MRIAKDLSRHSGKTEIQLLVRKRTNSGKSIVHVLNMQQNNTDATHPFQAGKQIGEKCTSYWENQTSLNGILLRSNSIRMSCGNTQATEGSDFLVLFTSCFFRKMV